MPLINQVKLTSHLSGNKDQLGLSAPKLLLLPLPPLLPPPQQISEILLPPGLLCFQNLDFPL